MARAPNSRPAAASRVEMTQIVLSGDTNALGTAFGGKVMQWIDVAAAVAARRHAGGVAVTASMDSLTFHEPIQLGDVVVLRAQVNQAWRSSMEVGVKVEVEKDPPAPVCHAASAYLTFVAVDDGGHPREVPSVAPESAEDHRRRADADHRRANRLQARRRRGERG